MVVVRPVETKTGNTRMHLISHLTKSLDVKLCTGMGRLPQGAAGDFGYPMGCSTVEGQREREREAMLDRLEKMRAEWSDGQPNNSTLPASAAHFRPV